jgi:hypothetical protein
MAAIDGDHSYLNLTAAGTTTVKAGPGVLNRIILNNPVAAATVTLWDSLTAAGTKIGTITVPASPQLVALSYNVAFNLGLTIVITGAPDITVSYK